VIRGRGAMAKGEMPSKSICIMPDTAAVGLGFQGLSGGECSKMEIGFKKFYVQIEPYKKAEMT
jgi:hypothetical protein